MLGFSAIQVKVPYHDNLQIQLDNLVQEAREVQEIQLVPWVQADQLILALLEFLVNHVLLEHPVGQKLNKLIKANKRFNT